MGQASVSDDVRGACAPLALPLPLVAFALLVSSCGQVQISSAEGGAGAGSSPDATHFVAAAHCPAGEMLRGYESTSATRLMCEPTSEWDPASSAETTAAPVDGVSSCPAKSVAVGWLQASSAIVCRPWRRALTDTAPLAADTNSEAEVGQPCHQSDYIQFQNGDFVDELPVCKTRNGLRGAVIELASKVIATPHGSGLYGFVTCGL